MNDAENQLIRRKLRAIQKLTQQIYDLLDAKPGAVAPAGGSRSVILTFLTSPGGMLRTHSEIVAGTGLKPRTVSWALKQMLEAGDIKRDQISRYSAKDAPETPSLEEVAINHIMWNQRLHRPWHKGLGPLLLPTGDAEERNDAMDAMRRKLIGDGRLIEQDGHFVVPAKGGAQ